MSEEHARDLALMSALGAVVKTLVEANVIDRDHLFSNLGGALIELQRIGKTDAAEFLAKLNESWLQA